MATRHLLVSYDVVDDRLRTRLAKLLIGFIDRVQKSVFEGPVDESRVEALRSGITEVIDQEVDSVRIYRLCPRCRHAVEVIGTGVYVDREAGDVII